MYTHTHTHTHTHYMGLPWWLSSKESTCNSGAARDAGSIPGLGRSLEEGMATHSSILAWRIPWTEEPGGLQSIRSQRVRHDWSDLARTQTYIIYTYIHICHSFSNQPSLHGHLSCFYEHLSCLLCLWVRFCYRKSPSTGITSRSEDVVANQACGLEPRRSASCTLCIWVRQRVCPPVTQRTRQEMTHPRGEGTWAELLTCTPSYTLLPLKSLEAVWCWSVTGSRSRAVPIAVVGVQVPGTAGASACCHTLLAPAVTPVVALHEGLAGVGHARCGDHGSVLALPTCLLWDLGSHALHVMIKLETLWVPGVGDSKVFPALMCVWARTGVSVCVGSL